MSFVAVAIGGAGLVTGVLGYEGAKSAADTQAQSAANSLALQKQMFDTSQGQINAAKANYQPYLDVGRGATYTLSQLTGANGTNPDYSAFYNSPDYKFAQQQGELGIERGANARGMNLSGGTLKDLATFNSGLATQQYGNYYGRLMQLAGLGSNAAAGLGNLATGQAANATTAGGNMGNTIQAQGQATASGIVGATNAITGGINSGISNSLLYNYLNKGNNPSSYGTGPAYGGGGEWGGSSMNPLPGLNASDYGAGF